MPEVPQTTLGALCAMAALYCKDRNLGEETWGKAIAREAQAIHDAEARKNLEKPQAYEWLCTCGKPFHEGPCVGCCNAKEVPK